MTSHAQIDQRSLALGRAVAARVVGHPELVARAKANVARWLTTCSPRERPALLEWLAVLDGPTEGVVWLLTAADDERAARLRQSNPFAGSLPPAERNAILRRFAAAAAADPATP